MLMTEDSLPFITGMGYRKKCDFVYDEFHKFDIGSVEQFDGMSMFLKTDLMDEFIIRILPGINKMFNLYTHNSDLGVGGGHDAILDSRFLICWNAQNVMLRHDKLRSIPIGLANKRWPHGDASVLRKIMDENNEKDNMVYCNFDINTNPEERLNCLKNISPHELDIRRPFDEYLRRMSRSFFAVSPNGNGVDCHKHWEAMYLKTVPIVTRSVNVEQYENYPFLVIDSWDDFNCIELTEELYRNIHENSNCNLYI